MEAWIVVDWLIKLVLIWFCKVEEFEILKTDSRSYLRIIFWNDKKANMRNCLMYYAVKSVTFDFLRSLFSLFIKGWQYFIVAFRLLCLLKCTMGVCFCFLLLIVVLSSPPKYDWPLESITQVVCVGIPFS